MLGFETLFSRSGWEVGGFALGWLMFVARGSGEGCCWARGSMMCLAGDGSMFFRAGRGLAFVVVSLAWAVR